MATKTQVFNDFKAKAKTLGSVTAELLEAWYRLQDEDPERDEKASEAYPYHKALEEISSDVFDWIEKLEEIR